MLDGLLEAQKEVLIDSPNFLIFVQGSWAPWNNPNNSAASEAVIKEGISSVLLYDSHRDREATQKAVTREQWTSAFDGKNYRDELGELRAKIDYVRKTHKPTNIFLSGNSYGAGLAALVSGDGIPDLSRVLLVSPQIDIGDVINPPNIYQNFSPITDFLSAISKYRGELTVVHGNQDSVVGTGQPLRLYQAAVETRRKNLVTLNTDHGFTNATDLYVQEHLKAFK